jgi:hypothetical protein
MDSFIFPGICEGLIMVCAQRTSLENKILEWCSSGPRPSVSAPKTIQLVEKIQKISAENLEVTFSRNL